MAETVAASAAKACLRMLSTAGPVASVKGVQVTAVTNVLATAAGSGWGLLMPKQKLAENPACASCS